MIALALGFLVAGGVLRGGDWPAAFEAYEKAMLSKPGDPVLTAECTRACVDWIAAESTPRTLVDLSSVFKFITDLSESDHLEEAREIVAALRINPVFKGRSDLVIRLAAFDADEEIRKSDLRQFTPFVWADADRSTSEEVVLLWDLCLAERRSGNELRPATPGENISALNGRLTVELFFGEDAASMQSIARIATANSRGLWRGRLPAVSGVARAVVSYGDRILFGDAFPVRIAQNLLRKVDAEKFVPGLLGGNVTSVKGGPILDGEYLSYRLNNPKVSLSGKIAVGPRVRIKPGCDYVLSGWLRLPTNRFALLCWRSLDGEGKVVGTWQIPSTATTDHLWRRLTQRVSGLRNDARGLRLPPETVYLEPVVDAPGQFDLADLSLIEIPMPSGGAER